MRHVRWQTSLPQLTPLNVTLNLSLLVRKGGAETGHYHFIPQRKTVLVWRVAQHEQRLLRKDDHGQD
jgi:hypothetical protein